MESHANELPLVVRNAIKAISDEKRQNILLYLQKEGFKSFTELSKDLSISKNNLSHHIKVLMRYGLLYNYYNRNEYADKYSFYELSKLGKGFLDSLLSFISKKTIKEEKYYGEPINAGESDYNFPDGERKVGIIRFFSERNIPVPVVGMSANFEEIGFGENLKKTTKTIGIGQEW